MSTDQELGLISEMEDVVSRQYESDRESLRSRAIQYYLSHPVSESYEMLLEGFREELIIDVENVGPQPSQQIKAAQKRKAGIFFLDDPWGRTLNEYLEKNPTVQPIASALDDLYWNAPKGKPTRKWLGMVEKLQAEHGKTIVDDVLRHYFRTLLDSDRTPKEGISYINEARLKWFLTLFTLEHRSSDAILLRDLALLCCQKVYCVGPISTSVANLCIKAIAALPNQAGAAELATICQRLKYPANVASLAQKQLELKAREIGVSVSQLQAASVPDFGLN